MQGAAAASEPAAEPAKPLSLDDVKELTKDSDFKPFMTRGVDAGVRNAAMKKLFTDPHFNVMDRLDIYIDDYSQPDPLPLSMLRQMASAKFLKLVDDDEDAEAAKAGVSAQAPAADAHRADPEQAEVHRAGADNAVNPANPASSDMPDMPAAPGADGTGASAANSTAPAAPAQVRQPTLAAPGHATALPPPDSPPEAFLPSGIRQEHHAHIDLRLQPDHATESPSSGRGAA